MKKKITMKNVFSKFASKVSAIAGNPFTFLFAISVIILWALSGKLFNYSDTWQLVINTTTTVITFLMVFLIQNTQNRDSKALHLKLDELLKAIHGARNSMVNIEELSEEELEVLHQDSKLFQSKYADQLKKHGIIIKLEKPSKKSNK